MVSGRKTGLGVRCQYKVTGWGVRFGVFSMIFYWHHHFGMWACPAMLVHAPTCDACSKTKSYIATTVKVCNILHLEKNMAGFVQTHQIEGKSMS